MAFRFKYDETVYAGQLLKGRSNRYTLPSKKFQATRFLHAVAILILPMLGVVYAAIRFFEEGLRPVYLILFFGMYVISWIGITVGFHRLYTHHAFKCGPKFRYLLGVFGSFACQGSLKYWVSNHRRHHMFTDVDGDVHSPHIRNGKPLMGLRKFWHSHIEWTFSHEITNAAVFAPDLIRDSTAKNVSSQYFWWVGIGLLIPAIIGGLVCQSWEGAFMGFIWGGLVRLFVTYHSVNAITSFAHFWGNVRFPSSNQSRNNFWLSIFTWGESWHNNHHTFPGSAMLGLRWWEIDLGGYVICLCELVGLTWDVRRPTRSLIESKLVGHSLEKGPKEPMT